MKYAVCLVSLYQLASNFAHAEPPAVEITKPEVLKQVAKDWRLPAHDVGVVDGSAVWAGPGFSISVGKKFLEFIETIKDEPIRQAMLEFSLLHEMWHLKQKDLGIFDSGDDERRRMIECDADALAAFSFVDYYLRHDKKLLAGDLQRIDAPAMALKQLPFYISLVSKSGSTKDSQLAEYRRFITLQFAASYAQRQWLWENQDIFSAALALPKYKLISRYVITPEAQGVSESLRYICHHVVGVKSGVSPMPYSLAGIESPTMEWSKGKFPQTYVDITNPNALDVIYSVIGVTGRYFADEEDTRSIEIFDVMPIEKILKSKQTARIMFKDPMLSSAGTKFRYENFSHIWDAVDDRVLVSVRYANPGNDAANCGDFRKRPEMADAVHQGLLRLGAAAKSEFALVSGPENTQWYEFPIIYRTYPANFEIEGTSISILRSEKSATALFILLETKSRMDAEKKFDFEVGRLRAACSTLLNEIPHGKFDSSLASFNVPRLTANSSAKLVLSENNFELEEPPTFSVTWHVTPSP